MKVEVTQKDLNKANHKEGFRVTDCLLATAIKRTYKPKTVRVAIHTALIDGVQYYIPDDFAEVIVDWCAGEHDKVAALLPLTVELMEKDAL